MSEEATMTKIKYDDLSKGDRAQRVARACEGDVEREKDQRPTRVGGAESRERRREGGNGGET